MSKTAIVYQSKSGSTEKYAKWIAEETGAELLTGKDIKAEDLLKYDTILFGGGLYAVGINGIKLLKDNLPLLKEKRIGIFAVGASPVREETEQFVKNENFTPEMKQIPFFLLRGGFNFNNCTFPDKILMLLLKAKLKMKRNRKPDEIGMLNTYRYPADWTNKKYTLPIVQFINRL